MSKRIIVVEDEVFVREELIIMLKDAGYQVDAITEFCEATEQILTRPADLLLLDLNLPYESGFQICRDIKNKTSLPILILTSREQLHDEVRALKLGADEYLTKPFRKARLLARIENVLKRYEGRANLLERDNFLLDRNTYTIYIDGHSAILPQNQGKLLEALLTSDTDVVSKEDLSMTLWGTTEFIDENALQVNIVRLKKAMKEIGMTHLVKAVRGKGYTLVKENDSDEEEPVAY